jgi:hypothetical protein
MKSLALHILNCVIYLALGSCNSNRIESIVSTRDSAIVPVKTSIGELSREFKTRHGQYVTVKGRFFYQFENVALVDDDIFPNDDMRFWLEFDKAINEKVLEKLSGDIVVIKGKIDTSKTGHLNGYLATVGNIYYIRQH